MKSLDMIPVSVSCTYWRWEVGWGYFTDTLNILWVFNLKAVVLV